MKITLVRQGETEWNYQGRLQGRTNIELNDTGRREIKRLKSKIDEMDFDYCYMSPLLRTVETAIILVGDRVETIPDKRLIERSLGDLEGKEKKDYNVSKYWDYNLNSNDLGVEPIQDLFKRCEEFFDYVKEKNKDQSILIVSHSAIINALSNIIKNNDKNKLEHPKIKNGDIITFEVK